MSAEDAIPNDRQTQVADLDSRIHRSRCNVEGLQFQNQTNQIKSTKSQLGEVRWDTSGRPTRQTVPGSIMGDVSGR